MFQITCTPSSHCDFEPGVDPIPVSQEGEVQFSLHLNLLGEPQTVSGPMEIGESLSIQCSEPGGLKYFHLDNVDRTFFLSLLDYTFDFEVLHKNKLYPATKIIARV